MKTLKFLGQLVLSLAAMCALFCTPVYSQALLITSGPAISVATNSPAWISGSALCPGSIAAAPVTAAVNTAQLSGTIPPQAALQNELYALSTCTIAGLTPGAQLTVTWIGAELYFNAAAARIMSMAINGVACITNLDIFAAADGQNIAIQRTCTATVSSAGAVVLTFSATINSPKFDALIITPAVPAVPVAAVATTDANGTTTIVIPAAAKVNGTCSSALAGSTYVMFAPQVP